MYACGIYACEMHAYEMLAHEIHACQMLLQILELFPGSIFAVPRNAETVPGEYPKDHFRFTKPNLD